MKIFQWILILGCAAIISCSGEKAQVPTDVVNIPNSASGKTGEGLLPAMEFTTLEHDFGKVIQGEVVSYTFKFKNTGNADLIIANISAACGCTASEYPKTPVKPGAEDKIEVIFNSSGKQGFQSKTLSVASNTQPSTTVLTIKAMVIIPEKE